MDKKPSSMQYRVYFDGSIQRLAPGGPTNPGGVPVGGWAFALILNGTDERWLTTGGRVYNDWAIDRDWQTSNNQAEYLALIDALERATGEYQLRSFEVVGDSELVVAQMQTDPNKKQYQVGDPVLLGLNRKAKEVIEGADVTWTHVKREGNAMADDAGRRAFDYWKSANPDSTIAIASYMASHQLEGALT